MHIEVSRFLKNSTESEIRGLNEPNTAHGLAHAGKILSLNFPYPRLPGDIEGPGLALALP